MNRDEVLKLIQNGYYDKVDAGDAVGAGNSLHPDIYWAHLPTTKADVGLSHTVLDEICGRDKVVSYLTEVLPRAVEAGLTHTVEKLVFDGTEGAMIGRTTSIVDPDINEKYFVWFSVRDGLLDVYDLRPF